MKPSRRKVLAGSIAMLAGVIAWVAFAFFWDMRQAGERVRSKGSVTPSPYGDVEYLEGGTGTPVLVIHGSGGGYDQGELIVRAVIGDDLHWIAPSRFGYLRSTLLAGATFDDQAHVYAHLLDRQGIKKTAVVALSHGGPSALLFALSYPDRVSSLTLISAGVTSSNAEDQKQANAKGDYLTAAFRYDPIYWLITKMFRGQLLALMGADKTVIQALRPEQRILVDQVIDYMNPVSLRSAGVVFDNNAKMPNERIAGITAPTLILHAFDDTLQLFRNAQYAASLIRDAKLIRFERGGHLLLCTERERIREALREHIRIHASN